MIAIDTVKPPEFRQWGSKQNCGVIDLRLKIKLTADHLAAYCQGKVESSAFRFLAANRRSP